MKKFQLGALLIFIVLAAYQLGRLSAPMTTAQASEADAAQVDVRQIAGNSSLVVYYPSLKKLFVYQPFAGPPTWPCAYSIQLGSPGGKVQRTPCENSD